MGHALADLHCILRLHLSIARFRALMRAAGQPASEPAAQQHASSAMALENGHSNEHITHDAAWQQPSEPVEARKGSIKRKRAPDEGVIEAQAKRSRHVADISLNGQPHDRQQESPASEQGAESSPSEESAGSLQWRCQRSCQVSIANVACASACLQVAPDAQAPSPSASAGHPQPGSGGALLAGEGTTTGQELPQLTVTLQWSCENRKANAMSWPSKSSAQHLRGPAAAVSMLSQPRCQVRTEPELPQTACQELAAMAGAPSSPRTQPLVSRRVPAKPAMSTQSSSTEPLSPPKIPTLGCALMKRQGQCCSRLHAWPCKDWSPLCMRRCRGGGALPGCALHLCHAPGSPGSCAGPSCPAGYGAPARRGGLAGCQPPIQVPARLQGGLIWNVIFTNEHHQPLKDQMTPLSTCWRCACQALAVHMMAQSSHI